MYIDITFWDVFFFLGKISLLAVALFPAFLVGLGIYVICYKRRRIAQADEVTLKKAQLVRFELDTHGLGGFVRGLETGEFVNLDASDFEGRQKIMASLTGANFGAPVAKKVVDGDKPVVNLPAIVSHFTSYRR